VDWFELLTGFSEGPYEETRAMLRVEEKRLYSLANGKSWAIGELDALFQVASQFNALEMTGPTVTPEDGVTRYEHDPTQGPACAIAAGAATIYRNYFAPMSEGSGQTSDRQLDGVADIGASLSQAIGKPVANLWRMRNGYALCTHTGLEAISKYLGGLNGDELDTLRGKLSIAVQSGVEVTDAIAGRGSLVSQAFCSALPVAYTNVPSHHWQPFATLVLEAAYEATMWAAVQNANSGGSNIVLLTLLGGGAFGNDDGWILDAMRRALTIASGFDLDARIVSYGAPSPALTKLVQSLGHFASATGDQGPSRAQRSSTRVEVDKTKRPSRLFSPVVRGVLLEQPPSRTVF
jgi:hypothetical protein